MKKKLNAFVFILMAVVANLAYAGQALQLSDGNIIGIYNQVNSFDIESALLAVTKAKSKQVVELATQVSTDHRGVRLAASELANSVSAEVALPSMRQAASHVHYQKMSELSRLDGNDFDREYLLHEIRFHTDAIAAVREVLIPGSENNELIEHFEAVLPHFEYHLSESIRIAKELGYY